MSTLMNEALWARRGQQSGESAKEDSIAHINEYGFPRRTVEEIDSKLKSESQLMIYGHPGVGKTFFCEHGLETMLRNQTGLPYRRIEAHTYQLRSHADVYTRPAWEDGRGLFWEETHIVNEIRAAQQAGEAVALVVEEATRSSMAMLNMFLKVSEPEMTLHLEQTGGRLTLPAHSKIVFLANPSGAGTNGRHEALEDRCHEINWPMPLPSVAAGILFHSISKQQTGSILSGLPERKLKDRPLSLEVLDVLANMARDFDPLRETPVSMRGLSRCADLLRHEPVLSKAISWIIDEFTRKLDREDPEIRAMIQTNRARLSSSLSVKGITL